MSPLDELRENIEGLTPEGARALAEALAPIIARIRPILERCDVLGLGLSPAEQAARKAELDAGLDRSGGCS